MSETGMLFTIFGLIVGIGVAIIAASIAIARQIAKSWDAEVLHKKPMYRPLKIGERFREGDQVEVLPGHWVELRPILWGKLNVGRFNFRRPFAISDEDWHGCRTNRENQGKL